MLHPTIVCGQGAREGDLVDYCCQGQAQKPGCIQYDAANCPAGLGLTGWACTGQNVPLGEELGPNQSRADFTYQACAVPTQAPNPAILLYCCYTPTTVVVGGTCVPDLHVPGCEIGNFGFACYGPDTPEDDYAPMNCPNPGFPGSSNEGYPATLYCCSYQGK
jgi:hypothetical protein